MKHSGNAALAVRVIAEATKRAILAPGLWIPVDILIEKAKLLRLDINLRQTFGRIGYFCLST
jgi:hypothetical protein